MSDHVRLLEVEDAFSIKGRGLIIMPLLPRPADGSFLRPFNAPVTLEKPDGSKMTVEGTFRMEHFSAPGDMGGYHSLVMFESLHKDDVPVGTKLFISCEDARKARGE